MHVSIIEAGKDHGTVQIHHPGMRPAVRKHRLGVTDRQDQSLPDCERLCPSGRCEYAAIVIDGVCDERRHDPSIRVIGSLGNRAGTVHGQHDRHESIESSGRHVLIPPRHHRNADRSLSRWDASSRHDRSMGGQPAPDDIFALLLRSSIAGQDT